jgi:DNA polymerase I-like protein with 3'-5' exonuclease and polymerase domains
MLAHEVNNEDFTKQVCKGDVHTFMKEAYELDDRDTGKTVTYAIIYGGQDPKIGSIVGGSAKDGKRIRGNAYKNLPGLEAVVERATQEFHRGRIELVDGSRTICPSKHAALNYKLQGGGARVMSLTAILISKAIRREGIDAYLVGSIHDEMQYDCAIEDVERLRGCIAESFARAGEQLGLRVPIEGTSAVGLCWAMTH